MTKNYKNDYVKSEKYFGVRKSNKTGRWMARLTLCESGGSVGRKMQIHLGYYNTEDEAGFAMQKAWDIKLNAMLNVIPIIVKELNLKRNKSK